MRADAFNARSVSLATVSKAQRVVAAGGYLPDTTPAGDTLERYSNKL